MKLTWLISWCLIVSVPLTAWSQSPTLPKTPQAHDNQLVGSLKVKQEVEKRGMGENASVKVVLRDKTEVKGYISQIDATSFQVTDRKTGRVSTIDYDNVDRVRGGGLSKSSKILIGVGVGVAVAAISFGLIVASWHGN